MADRDDAPSRLDWKVAVRESDLPAPSKLLCFALETRMSVESPHPYPSIPTLVEDTGLSRRAVQSHLRSLTEDSEFLRKRGRFDEAGRQTSNEYRLVLEDEEGRVQEVHPGVQEMRGGGRSRCAGEGAGDAPEVEKKKKKEEKGSVRSVFDLCRELRAQRMGKTSGPPLQLTDKRKSKIRARLREGFTEEQLKTTARGFYADDWQGRDQYLDPVYAFKDDDTVHRHLQRGQELTNGGDTLSSRSEATAAYGGADG